MTKSADIKGVNNLGLCQLNYYFPLEQVREELLYPSLPKILNICRPSKVKPTRQKSVKKRDKLTLKVIIIIKLHLIRRSYTLLMRNQRRETKKEKIDIEDDTAKVMRISEVHRGIQNN